MSVYAAGRGLTGAFAARLLLRFKCQVVASSGAALVTLALLLGGERALKLLRSRRFSPLLMGLGANHRIELAGTWLRTLQVPQDLWLGEFLRLRRPQLHVVLYDGTLQAPILFGLDGSDAPLADLVAALCSLSPVGTRQLFDVEVLVASEALACALKPVPLLQLAPSSKPLEAPGCFTYASKVLGLLDLLLLNIRPPLLICRIETPSAFAGLGSSTVHEPWCLPLQQNELYRSCGALLLLYLVAGLLQALEFLECQRQEMACPSGNALVRCTTA